MPAPVTYFEVNAKDAIRAQEFYSKLFDWKINVMAPEANNYGMVDTGVKMGINGGIGQTNGPNSNITFYVQVEDVQAYVDKAVSLGGSVIVPMHETPSVVFANIADPEGNIVGIVKGPQTPPREAKPKKLAAKRKRTAKSRRSAKKSKRR